MATGKSLAGRGKGGEAGSPSCPAFALAADPHRLAHAKVANLFLSPACHVMMFFADLFGLEETYNVPGTQTKDNWTLRVPQDFVRCYEEGRRKGEVLNLHAVMALALKARQDINCPELILSPINRRTISMILLLCHS